MAFLERCYAQQGRIDEREFTSEDERDAWWVYTIIWVSETDIDRIRYIRSIMPLRYLAQMDGRREEEYT